MDRVLELSDICRTDYGGEGAVRPTFVWLTTLVAVLFLAAPLAVEAQTGRVWRIGFLTTSAVEAVNPGLVAFRQRLRELGYVEGQNVALEIRSAEGRPERFPGLAAELVVSRLMSLSRAVTQASSQHRRPPRRFPSSW